MGALAQSSSSGPPLSLPPAPPLTYKRLVSSADTLAALPLFPSHVALWGGVVKLIIGIGVAGVWGVGLGIGARFSSLGGGLWVGAVVALSGFLSVCGARRPHSQVYLVSLLCVSALSFLASGLLLLLSVAATAADAGATPPDFLMKMEWAPLPLASAPAKPSPPTSRNAAVVVSATLCVLSAVDCIVSALCITIATRQLCRICVLKASPGGRWRLSEGHSRKERLYRWLGQQKTIFPIGTATGSALRPGGPIPSVSHFVPLTESPPSSSMDDPKQAKGSGYFSHPSIAPDKLEAQDFPSVYCTPKLGQPTLVPNERYSCANPILKPAYHHNTFAKFANAGNFSSKKRKFHEREAGFDTVHHQKVFRPAVKAYHKDESSTSQAVNKRHGQLSYSQSCLLTSTARQPSSSGLRTPRSSATTSAIGYRKNIVHPHTLAVSSQRNIACAASVAPSLHSFYSDPRQHLSLPYYYKGCATPQRYYSVSEGYYALQPVRRFERGTTPRQGQVTSMLPALYAPLSQHSWHYSAPLYSTMCGSMCGYAPQPRCSQAYGCPTQKSDRRRRRKERLRRRHTAAALSPSSEKKFEPSERRRDKRRKCEELTDDQIDRTYTGLDRAIAEVFIDSTMQTSR